MCRKSLINNVHWSGFRNNSVLMFNTNIKLKKPIEILKTIGGPSPDLDLSNQAEN